jgi:ribulose-phosphate 3-epimerase
MIKISPSVLACDFSKFGEEIKKVTDAGAEYIHLDVMDGHFVPNISFGIPVVEAARKVTDAVLDVHLMITSPERYIDAFAKAGADIITFHYEATNHPEELIDQIHAAGKLAGISIKPATPTFVLEPLVRKVDMVLVMTVEPGFGGQKLIQNCVDKVREIKRMCTMFECCPEIEVDGGITPDNVQSLINNGANVIVAGSSVFKAENPELAVKTLKGDLLDS